MNKALKHEDTRKHVQYVRQRFSQEDRKCSANTALEDEEQNHDEELDEGDIAGATRVAVSSVPTNKTSVYPQSYEHIGASDPSLRTWDQYLDELELDSTIPGPQLPDDPPNAIYDDYAGNMSELGNPDPVRAPNPTESTGKDSHMRLPFEQPVLKDDPFDFVSRVPLLQADITIEGGESLTHPTLPTPSKPEDYTPWRNQMECILTLLSAFPRALFSTTEIQILRWCIKELGVQNVTSLEELKACRERLSKMFGSNPCTTTSQPGYIYSYNSLKTIIAHEIANPITRARLSVFPEDGEGFMSNSTHGAKWRNEVNGVYASPMARISSPLGSFQDYFVNEPALAFCDNNIVPLYVTRWFKRKGTLHAIAHQLIPLPEENGYAIDGGECVEIPSGDFVLSLPEFRQVHQEYDLPPPDNLLMLRLHDNPSRDVPWTEPAENPWRARANGKEVIAVPILGYCDDTSGNLGKKWNKHNSYLFVLAGLPQEDTRSPFHIHFLATSNIASPLEMLEAIARESEEAVCEGVWAYDAIKQDMVLAIVWWLALEGDNPMQSELCSHVGMNGKFFCRVCHVAGKDRSRTNDEPNLEAEVKRLNKFMTAGLPRFQFETQTSLNNQLKEFTNKRFTAADDISTDTGVKDKYLSHYLSTMKAAYNRAVTSRQLTSQTGKELISNLRTKMPERLFNPALYLPGLDVNQDTPVEVLHVVLLGITKYFWRDAVSRQGNANRAILIARLNSFDVCGSGISPLRGKSLVHYAKSLTGSNFRDILQVAPAVLYDLLEPRIYSMWIALCQLAPLVFQPEIQNVEDYLHELEVRIDRLLLATVMSNPQWFNKPKFHVLLHLPGHVRRFGPPILFATETFESYNFVIRLRSIHSNRQSPSADIGASFSLMHAIRHLVCGGYFQLPAEDVDGSMPGRNPPLENPWIQAGPKVLAFLRDEVFLKFMGMSFLSENNQTGICRVDSTWDSGSIAWADTQTYHLCNDATLHTGNLTNCKSVRLADGANAELNGFIIISQSSYELKHYLLGRICEILADSASRKCIIATASAFHNCASHQCTSSNTKPMRQERQTTSTFEDEVKHSVRPDDLILNIAQLRSAQALGYLYQPLTPSSPSKENAIRSGIAHQKAIKQARQVAQDEREATKAKRRAKQTGQAEKQVQRAKHM